MSDNNKISYCICCGAKFEDGTGWIEPHKFPCANERYGWNFTTDKKESFISTIAEHAPNSVRIVKDKRTGIIFEERNWENGKQEFAVFYGGVTQGDIPEVEVIH